MQGRRHREDAVEIDDYLRQVIAAVTVGLTWNQQGCPEGGQ